LLILKNNKCVQNKNGCNKRVVSNESHVKLFVKPVNMLNELNLLYV